MLRKLGSTIALALAAAALPLTPASAQGISLEAQFDSTLGTEVRAPQSFDAVYETSFERRIAALADGTNGRIGVYALDLTTGREVSILGDQRFPMASTSKVAIAMAYLAQVDQGRKSLTSEYYHPRNRVYYTARQHIERTISYSDNHSTDVLLEQVGGPQAVNAWARSVGISEFNLTRDIKTLIAEDGRIDPATQVDDRDSATPRAMGQLMAGIYHGRWLSASSNRVIMAALEGTTTGRNRMASVLPMSAQLAHKTGTLSRTASDIGIFYTADRRPIAAAIYVTGQSPSQEYEDTGPRSRKYEARAERDSRIAQITSALYEGFRGANDNRVWASASYGAAGQ